MCGILCCGPVDKFQLTGIQESEKLLQNRGPDFSTIQQKNEKYWFVVSQLIIVGNEVLPIEDEEFSFIGNIELYNYKQIHLEHLKDFFKWEEHFSDAHIILPLLKKYINAGLSLEKAIYSLFSLLEGDYAFIIGDNIGNLAIGRDPIGIRPLYYALDPENKWAFCSSPEPLFRIGFSSDQIEIVPPGKFCIINSNFKNKTINWLNHPQNIKNILSNRLESTLNVPISNYEASSEVLFSLIKSSIEKRIPSKEFSMFLSGGIDSSVILGMLLKLEPKNKIRVVSVGYPKSPDLFYAEFLCNFLDIPIHKVELSDKYLKESFKKVKHLLKYLTIINKRGTVISPLDFSISLPLYFSSNLANKLKTKVAFSGQGADELFIGYNKYYEKEFDDHENKLITFLNNDLQNISYNNLNRDDIISMDSSIEIRFPYLDLDLIKWTINQDANLFYSKNKEIRKVLLRKVAAKLGLPEKIISRPKKAGQYGTKIMNKLREFSKPHSLSEYINSI